MDDILKDTLPALVCALLQGYYLTTNQTHLILTDSNLAECLGFNNNLYKIYNPNFSSDEFHSTLNSFGSQLESSILSSHKSIPALAPYKKDIRKHQKNELEYLINEAYNNSDALDEDEKIQDVKILKEKYRTFTPNTFSPINFTRFIIKDFYSHTSPSISSRLFSTLSNLEKNNIILWETIYFGFDASSNIERPLTPKEKEIYANIKNFILNDSNSPFSAFSLSTILNSNSMRKNYYSYLSSLIQEYLNLNSVYKTNYITLSSTAFSSSKLNSFFDSSNKSIENFLKQNNSSFISSIKDNSFKRLCSSTSSISHALETRSYSSDVGAILYSKIISILLKSSISFSYSSEALSTYSYPTIWSKFYTLSNNRSSSTSDLLSASQSNSLVPPEKPFSINDLLLPLSSLNLNENGDIESNGDLDSFSY